MKKSKCSLIEKRARRIQTFFAILALIAALIPAVSIVAQLLGFDPIFTAEAQEDQAVRFVPYANTEDWYIGVAVGMANWSCLAAADFENGSKITYMRTFDLRYFVILQLANGLPELEPRSYTVLVSFDNGESFREKVAEVLSKDGLAVELTEDESSTMVSQEQIYIFFEGYPNRYSENMDLSGLGEATEFVEMCHEESSEFIQRYRPAPESED